MKKLLLSALLSLGFLTLPFASAEAATTKDQLIVDTQLNKMDYYQDGKFIKVLLSLLEKSQHLHLKALFKS